MASRFVIQFSAPANVDGNLEFVIEADTLESESSSSATPVSGPLTKVSSPAIAIDTEPEPEEAVATLAGVNAKIIPLKSRVEETGQQPVFAIEFDENVELPNGMDLNTAAADWLEFAGIQIPDSDITVRAMETRTLTAQNAPCTDRRFAHGVVFNLRVEVRPPLTTALSTSDFAATNATVGTVTEIGKGRLYQVPITFPTTGMGDSTVTALRANISGVDADVQLVDCKYGLANLRAANFPTMRQTHNSCFTFDIVAEPSLTADPLPTALTVTNGSVVGNILPIQAGRIYRATIRVAASGTGNVIVTATAAGWTNIDSNLQLGSVAFGA